MKVAVTFDLDENERQAISDHYGFTWLATANECRAFIRNESIATLETMISESDGQESEEEEDKK